MKKIMLTATALLFTIALFAQTGNAHTTAQNSEKPAAKPSVVKKDSTPSDKNGVKNQKEHKDQGQHKAKGHHKK